MPWSRTGSGPLIETLVGPRVFEGSDSPGLISTAHCKNGNKHFGMEHLQPDYESVSTFYAYYETVSGSDGVTDPSNAPEGIKLGGRAKPLLPDRTVGDILWHNNGQNLMSNFRFRTTAVPAK